MKERLEYHEKYERDRMKTKSGDAVHIKKRKKEGSQCVSEECWNEE